MNWMKRRKYVTCSTAILVTVIFVLIAESENDHKQMNSQSNYFSINNLKMYYEIHGTGKPLILLHGGLTTIDSSFGKVLPELSKSWQVIAIEQQGHGHTADIDRPMTYEQMAEDTAALLKSLRIESANFIGYSDGGIVALGIAIRHPGLVRKLVVAGANYNNNGLYPEILQFFKNAKVEDVGSEMQNEYTRVAPRAEDWPKLVAKATNMAATWKGWRSEDIRSINAPVLVIIGDDDIVRPEHAVEMFRLIPHCQLAVLPGTRHETIMERDELLLSIIPAFLD
jgi:pimeloyl-ACP methyl ester carboxylesterase